MLLASSYIIITTHNSHCTQRGHTLLCILPYTKLLIRASSPVVSMEEQEIQLTSSPVHILGQCRASI